MYIIVHSALIVLALACVAAVTQIIIDAAVGRKRDKQQ